jgi:RhtB (resistance to homoserine/threonine) family protein
LIAYILFAVVLAITPGPDMVLVTKNALRHGRRAALMTALGVSIGLAVWTTASALGIAGLIASSAAAFNLVRVLGAAYLIWLGLHALWHSLRNRPAEIDEGTITTVPTSASQSLRQGFLGNLLNPKAALIYTSLIPQFIPAGAPVASLSLRLGLILNLIVMLWLLGYALVASGAGEVLRRPSINLLLERITGCVLVGLGLRLATERGRG